MWNLCCAEERAELGESRPVSPLLAPLISPYTSTLPGCRYGESVLTSLPEEEEKQLSVLCVVFLSQNRINESAMKR